MRSYEEAVADARGRNDAAALGPSQEVMRQWFPAVTERIQQEQTEVGAVAEVCWFERTSKLNQGC